MAVTSLLACATEAPESTPSAAALASNEKVTLPVRTDESPSGGTAFTFCPNETADAPLNLTNAAWLAMASANVYASPGLAVPQLLDLGFGDAADSHWQVCGEDLVRVRTFETEEVTRAELAAAMVAGPDGVKRYMTRLLSSTNVLSGVATTSFGTCARDFFSGPKYQARDAEGEAELPSASFRRYLLQTNDALNSIQLYGAAPRSFLERKLGRGSTEAMIAKHAGSKVIILAFRGTETPRQGDVRETLADVFADLNIFKNDLEEHRFSPGWGHAHGGFVEAVESLDEGGLTLLTTKLRELVRADPKSGVWITGHSLGGALATLMTARLLDRQERGESFGLRGLYTFGAPKVGNDVFAGKLEASARAQGVKVARFRNDEDPVPGLPAAILFNILNYHHAGPPVLLEPGALTFPREEPGLGTTVSDHAISGLDPGTRQRISGYYSRIVTQLGRRSDPSLVSCANR